MTMGEKIRQTSRKLTDEQIREFKKEMFDHQLNDLAVKYGVSSSQLCRIRSGQYWGHIK